VQKRHNVCKIFYPTILEVTERCPLEKWNTYQPNFPFQLK
jgi:hypothetical protein